MPSLPWWTLALNQNKARLPQAASQVFCYWLRQVTDAGCYQESWFTELLRLTSDRQKAFQGQVWGLETVILSGCI